MSQANPPARPSEQRSSSFVNSRLQGRILVRVAVLWSAYHVVLWCSSFGYRYAQYRMETGERGLSIPFGELSGQICSELLPFVLVSLAVLPILAYEVIQTTHRISGPLVRLDRGLRQMKEGRNVAPIRIRRADLVHGVIDAFNDYVVAINQHGVEVPTLDHNEEEAPVDIGDRLLAEAVALQTECREAVRPQATDAEEHTAGITETADRLA